MPEQFSSHRFLQYLWLIAVFALLVACGGGGGGGVAVAPLGPVPLTPNVPDGEIAYSMPAGSMLNVAAPGVLETRTSESGSELIAELADPPVFGSLDLNSDGGFRYNPIKNFPGRDSFSVRILDGDLPPISVSVTVSLPNIVLILVDDMGQGDVAAFNPGSGIQTPNLDLMAAAGMSLTRAHSTTALCSPSRYALLTGNYPYRGELSIGVFETFSPATMIIPGQQTLGHLFAAAGYRSAFVGKMHNGAAFWNRMGDGYTSNHADADFTRAFDRGPTQFGFDYSFVLPAGLSGPPYAFFENDRLVRYNDAFDDYLPFLSNSAADDAFVPVRKNQNYNGGQVSDPGFAMDNYSSLHVGATLTAQSIEFVRHVVAENAVSSTPQPFFLYLASPELHVPWTPPNWFNANEPRNTQSDAGGTRIRNVTPISDRADMVYQTDVMLGAITAELSRLEILDQTLIIFTSDNGADSFGSQSGYADIGERRESVRGGAVHLNAQGIENGTPLRGRKALVYEGGHRVPFIARWGSGTAGNSRIVPGSVSSVLFGLHDLPATFAAMLGVDLPAGQFNDSQNFLPQWLGQTTAESRDEMIAQGSPASTGIIGIVDRAYYRRDDDGSQWKLTVHSSTRAPGFKLDYRELYNLTDDVGETNDMFDDPDMQGWLATLQSEYFELIQQKSTR